MVLTKKGSETVEEVHKHFVSRFEAVVDHLGEKDSKTLAGLLNRVTDFLSDSQ